MHDENPKPHDAFMKSMLADISRARTFLQRMLPSELCVQLDLASLQPVNTSFLRRDLQEFFSDALFRVPLAQAPEKQAIVSILLEHKSYPDPHVAVQMLTYLAEGYRAQISSGKPTSKKKPDTPSSSTLHPIIPFLFYHGKVDWEFRPLQQLFDSVYGSLLHYIPAFETIYSNLRKLPEQTILQLQEAWLRTVLLTQKYSHDPEALVARFKPIFESLHTFEERNFLIPFIVYFSKTSALNREEFLSHWKQLPSPQNTDIMHWMEEALEGYQKGIEEGMERGILQGISQGIEQGISQGIERGLQQGQRKEKREIILRGVDQGLSLVMLSSLTGYSEAEVIQIIQEG